MPPARSSLDDAGISSIIGFIVGFALLAGSMAAVAYFMVTIPDAGTPEESKDLESYVQNAADALTKSPGHPHEWHESDCQADTYGLLRAGSSIAQLDKLTCFKTGDANATNLLEANDLRNEGIRLYAEGTVVPLSTMQAPSTTEYALLAGDLAGNDLDEVTKDGTSQEVLALYESADDGFESEAHEWAWRLDRHPEEGLGNTFVDHPWHVHTQMTPVMAGLKATYTMADIHDHGEDWGQAAMAASDDYEASTKGLSRWHIAINDAPSSLPAQNSLDGDFVLTVAGCNHNNPKQCDESSGSSPAPHWKTTDGMRSFAVLPSTDITGAQRVNITFQHLLRTSGDETEDKDACDDVYDDPEAYDDCVEIRPSIRFWNTTDDSWTRLSPDPSDCSPDEENTWNDTGSQEGTSNWDVKTVDLCEAIEHTDGKLWIGFEWFTECKASGEGTSCGNPEPAQRSWLIADVDIVVDDESVYQTVFKSNVEMATTVASQGVDHGLASGLGDDEEARLVAPLRNFTERGGNLIAFAPGTAGELFSYADLNAVSYSGSDPVKTVDADRLVMRMPHKLPLEHNDYEATAIAWDPSQDIDVVQRTEDEAAATLVTKTTSSGAKVTGVAYDITSMDTDLRDKLLDNLYTSAVFLDPTFKTEDASIPASATVPVSSAQRIVLAEATETGEHHVPLEVTLYAWPEGLG